jgi:hypothetical protein
MMKGIVITGLISIFFFINISLLAQGSGKARISEKVSCPEKWWAVMHPFIAGKAFAITLNVIKVCDSIRNDKLPEIKLSAQQADAFRHSFWMASLVQEIKSRKARSLGIAHEKGNYRSFKKEIREGKPGSHDEAAKQMDLWNNEVGIKIGMASQGSEPRILMNIVTDSIEAGAMKVISVDADGKFLDCEGNIIPEENYLKSWKNNKCLVPSDTQVK